MPPLSPSLLVAFDAGSVCAARLAWGLRGARVQAVARAALASGALVPAAAEANVVRRAEIVAALRDLRARVAGGGRRACLVLPDGIARIVLLEPPAGADARDFARFRLGPSLPYPAAEAVVDVLRVSRERVIAAAVRRSIVEGYEAVAAEAGLVQERIELAPLAAVAGLRRGASATPRSELILGDAAACFAAWDGAGALCAFRSRRRSAESGEIDRLREELGRTARLAGEAAAGRVRVVGSGAVAVLRALSFAGVAAEPGWRFEGSEMPVDPVELAWLGAALA